MTEWVRACAVAELADNKPHHVDLGKPASLDDVAEEGLVAIVVT